MPDFDAGFKIVAHSAGQGLTRMAGIASDKWQPVVDTMQTTERLADRAFRAENEHGKFIVYMEAYTRWSESAQDSLTRANLLTVLSVFGKLKDRSCPFWT